MYWRYCSDYYDKSLLNNYVGGGEYPGIRKLNRKLRILMCDGRGGSLL